MSDNASTYRSAATELHDLLNSKALVMSLEHQDAEWKFIPKKAPWFGGYWERLIGVIGEHPSACQHYRLWWLKWKQYLMTDL